MSRRALLAAAPLLWLGIANTLSCLVCLIAWYLETKS